MLGVVSAVGRLAASVIEPRVAGRVPAPPGRRAAGKGQAGYQDGGVAKIEERKALYYRDTAKHDYRSPNPGISPETGNDLEPVYDEEGTFKVPVDKQQLIGVQFEPARFESADRQFRATGKVALDETRISKVHSKLEGWIDQVHVDFTGKEVRKGQPLLTLYSPEMLATQQEYLLALRSREVMK